MDIIENAWGIVPAKVFGFTLATFSIAIAVLWRAYVRMVKDLKTIAKDNAKDMAIFRRVIEEGNREAEELNRRVEDLSNQLRVKSNGSEN